MPEMNEDSVLIQLKYCGVCYSEHYEWKTKGGAFGHEPMGTIVQVGKNVEGFSVGDRVSGLWGSTLPGAGGMVQYAVANPSKDTVVKLPAVSYTHLDVYKRQVPLQRDLGLPGGTGEERPAHQPLQADQAAGPHPSLH